MTEPLRYQGTTRAKSLVDDDDGEAICAACGHRAYNHVAVAGAPGDCLHRTDGRYDCDCLSFTPTQED